MSAERFSPRRWRATLAVAALIAVSAGWSAPPVDDPLISAAKNGQLDKVQAILAAGGANVNVVDAQGYTPVMWALSRGGSAMVQALFSHGAALPADSPQFSPLIEAAKAGAADNVSLLLAKKANVNVRDASGATPLQWAVGRNHASAAAALISAGADVNSANGHGQTALIQAAQLGLTALVKQLGAAPGIKLDARDRFGYTALMWAAHNGHSDTAQALVTLGADRAAKAKDGLTAAQIAKSRGFAGLAASL